jgi:hypothetical protein
MQRSDISERFSRKPQAAQLDGLSLWQTKAGTLILAGIKQRGRYPDKVKWSLFYSTKKTRHIAVFLNHNSKRMLGDKRRFDRIERIFLYLPYTFGRDTIFIR